VYGSFEIHWLMYFDYDVGFLEGELLSGRLTDYANIFLGFYNCLATYGTVHKLRSGIYEISILIKKRKFWREIFNFMAQLFF
jgi:hypothetical protein